MKFENLRSEIINKIIPMDLIDNPLDFLNKWLKEAHQAGIKQANSMCLSTVSKDGFPSSRIVLLKEFTTEGVIFYTNYNSQKSQEIQENENVSVNLFWVELGRQVKFKGRVKKTSREKSEKYFQSRPKESQYAAICSLQSEKIESREILLNAYKRVERKYSEQTKINCPENWGGYLIIPYEFEFWSGQKSRLHDRVVVESKNGEWKKYRKYP